MELMTTGSVSITDLEKTKNLFDEIGIKHYESEENPSSWVATKEDPTLAVPVKYLSIGILHLHFGAEGNYLAMQCEGDSSHILSTKLAKD